MQPVDQPEVETPRAGVPPAQAVSVVIPTWQRAHLIGRALGSVLPQLLAGDEILVIDDGSTDGTQVAVAAFDDPRIRYLPQANAGAGAARNRGIELARNPLVAFLDSDDVFLPGKLALQRHYLAARPDILFCFTNFARDYDGVRHHRDIGAWHPDRRSWTDIMGPPRPYSEIAALPPDIADFPVHEGDIYASEMSANYILTSCLMVRRAETVGRARFTQGVPTYEDWEYFGLLARLGKGAFLDIDTAVQHAHPGPRLTDAGELVCAEARLRVLRLVWGADPDFLATHGRAYRDLLHRQQRIRLRGLLAAGRMAEAREALREMRRKPPLYRAAAALPPSMLRSGLSLRRAMRSCLGLLG